jgi:DNA polymerase-3 subunit beta
MEVPMIIQRGPLHDALVGLKPALDRYGPTCLQGVHIHATGRAVQLTATDRTVQVRTTLPATGRLDVRLPLTELLDRVGPVRRAERDEPMELQRSRAGSTTVTVAGVTTTLEPLPESNALDHPAAAVACAAWAPEAVWDASTFRGAVGWVLPAASRDVTRPHLTGLLFDNEAVVATDGHRLHLARLDGLNAGPTVVPARALNLLLRVLPPSGEVTAARVDRLLRFQAGCWEVVVPASDAPFPPYEQVVPRPADAAFTVVIERAHLRDALARLPRLPVEDPPRVCVRVNGQMFLERQGEQAVISLPVPVVACSHEGPEYVIGLNRHYLADALAAGDAVVTAGFAGVLDPVRIEPSERLLAIVMPLRA